MISGARLSLSRSVLGMLGFLLCAAVSLTGCSLVNPETPSDDTLNSAVERVEGVESSELTLDQFGVPEPQLTGTVTVASDATPAEQRRAAEAAVLAVGQTYSAGVSWDPAVNTVDAEVEITVLMGGERVGVEDLGIEASPGSDVIRLSDLVQAAADA